MKQQYFSKTYKISAATHNMLARTERIVVAVAMFTTVAKLIAAIVMKKSIKK